MSGWYKYIFTLWGLGYCMGCMVSALHHTGNPAWLLGLLFLAWLGVREFVEGWNEI